MEQLTYDNVEFFTLKGMNTKCKILDVYDGDTVTVAIELQGFGYKKFNCRLFGIDTEEMRGGTAETKQNAIHARNILIYMLTGIKIPDDHKLTRSEIRSRIEKSVEIVDCVFDDMDKYGRPLITLFDKNKSNVNQLMIQKGLAVAYYGGTK